MSTEQGPVDIGGEHGYRASSRWGKRERKTAEPVDFALAVERERAKMVEAGYVETPSGRYHLNRITVKR